MRRRQPPSVNPTVPDELLAGACIEVWAPEAPRVTGETSERADFVAGTRWLRAKHAWLRDQTIRPAELDHGATSPHPWSLEDPVSDDRLAAARRALARLPHPT